MVGVGRPTKYEGGAKHVTLSVDGEILGQFQKIMLREGGSTSAGFTDYMVNYIKAHGSGNPSYEITQWVNDKDFRAVPTILAGDDTWDKYLKDCDKNEWLKLSVRATHILNTIAKYKHEEKGNKLPPKKRHWEEIQDALDKDKERNSNGWV